MAVEQRSVCLFSVDCYVDSERKHLSAANDFSPSALLKLEQPLSQRIARRLGFAVGPQQFEQTRAWRAAFTREVGDKGGIAPLEYMCLACRQAQLRSSEERNLDRRFETLASGHLTSVVRQEESNDSKH